MNVVEQVQLKMKKLLNWFYGTKLGCWYLEYLLWSHKDDTKPIDLSTPTIVRQYSLLREGVTAIKKIVNSRASNAVAYHEELSKIEDLTVFADRPDTGPQAQYSRMFKESEQTKKTKDIETALDHAKMIDQRINDYTELQAYNKKRQLLKDMKQAKKEGNIVLFNKLEKEWNGTYGKRNI